MRYSCSNVYKKKKSVADEKKTNFIIIPLFFELAVDWHVRVINNNNKQKKNSTHIHDMEKNREILFFEFIFTNIRVSKTIIRNSRKPPSAFIVTRRFENAA